MQEQRALYTWAKRREGAMPDRVGLTPKRQRTGSDLHLKLGMGNFCQDFVLQFHHQRRIKSTVETLLVMFQKT
jgi:hypothetical protein